MSEILIGVFLLYYTLKIKILKKHTKHRIGNINIFNYNNLLQYFNLNNVITIGEIWRERILHVRENGNKNYTGVTF
jgi:hypothetical protein